MTRRFKAPKHDLKIQYHSDEKTIFPDAWQEVVRLVRKHSVKRVVGFNVTIYFGPDAKEPTR